MKKYLLLIVLILLTGCSNNSFMEGYSSNLLSNKDQNKLQEILSDNKVKNTETFISLVKDYNKGKDYGCGMSNWKETDSVNYDDSACIDRYEKTHKVSDGNCRLTSFILIKDRLRMEKEKTEYGNYLMFDIDVLENNKEYDFLNKDFNKFITLFDEIDVSKVDENDFDKVLPDKWKEYGIKLAEGNLSLINVVMYDKNEKKLFIGHTGVLVKYNDGYIFIEKIAFEGPYQISILEKKKDLFDIFSKRSNYFETEEDKPFVYENDKLLGRLTKK